MLSLPPQLRRGLLQQHVFQRSQIQPSQLVLGLQPQEEPWQCRWGEQQLFITLTPRQPGCPTRFILMPRRKMLF